MSHFGQTFDGDLEPSSEPISDSLRAIAQRLDRLRSSLLQSNLPDPEPSLNSSEISAQLQQDAAFLRQTASHVEQAEAAQLSWQGLANAGSQLGFVRGTAEARTPSTAQLDRRVNRVLATMLRFRLYRDRSLVYELRLGDWEAMYGYTQEEAEADPSYWLSGIPLEDREAIVFPALDALMTEDFSAGEYRFRRKDGSLRWFQANLISQRDEAADCWMITCIETDITERKQSEHHLRKLQERFSIAFRASPIAMSITRLADGRYVEVNDRFLELVEYKREELIGKTSVELEIFQPQERAFLLLLLMDTPGPVEWWFHTRSGRRRLARIASETIELNDELHLLILTEDITDYRRVQSDLQRLNEELESIVAQRTQELQASQTALQTSQRQLEAVLDNSPLLIYLLDLENRHLLVNRRYEEVVGRSRQELIGLPAEAVWNCNLAEPSDYMTESAFDHIRFVRETGETIEVEEVLYIQQQKRIYLSSKFPLFDSNGNLYAVGGICLDITERVRIEEERKQAEAAVAQREREYRTLVENSPDLIMRVDREGRFLYVSPSFSLAFGVSQQDCIGKTDREVGFPEEIVAQCQAERERLFNQCEQQTLEFSLMTLAGLRCYQSWAVPELDEQGNVVSALIVAREITEMKQAEQRLQQAIVELERVNRLKDEFLSTVSHELRTPVSNMKLSMRMLEVAMRQANFEPDARLRQYLSILNQECDREISLINDLLDLQKLEANKRELNLEAIDLESWLPRLLEPFQERAQTRQQQLRFELPDVPLPKLITDPNSLDRILAELLNNACKYTPPGEQIVLRAAVESPHILLSVHNSGIEIPIEELPRIFDKFYRVPSTDPWKQGGTGLGLALIQKLIEHLQGSIQVESSAAQTIFTVTLPIRLPIDILPVSQND